MVCIDLKFGSNEFHNRIVDGKNNDLENVSKLHLGTLYCEEFLDYNCYQLNIHLDSLLNIQELYCYELSTT